MKATEQNFPVIMFIVLYKVVRMFEVCGWNPNLWPYNENFWTVLSCVQELLLCFTRPFQSFEFLRTNVNDVIIHLKCSSSSLIWFRFPQSIAKYILTLDLIGSKSEINIDTKTQSRGHHVFFNNHWKSIRNFYFCRWLLLVKAIFSFRPGDFRESLPPLFNLSKKSLSQPP